MPKVVDGSIVCRISYAPEHTGKKFYCDHCGAMFDDRENLPCDEKVPMITKLPEPEAYTGELSDNFEITGTIPLKEEPKLKKKK